MRLVRSAHDACHQAREHLSLALDGELPQLDRVRLDAHLAGCADCRASQGELSALTRTLRVAPLQVPAFDVILPRTLGRRMLLVPAAAAAVAALFIGQSLVHNAGYEQRSAVIPPAQQVLFGPNADVAPIRQSEQRRASRLTV
jgi:anti-sigma factor RsiW